MKNSVKSAQSAQVIDKAAAKSGASVVAAEAAKPRAIKFVANDAAKAEQFSEKTAFACVKTAFQQDAERRHMRAYLEGIGYTQSILNALNWQELHSVTKSGRFSTYAVINALARIAKERDLTGEKAAAAERAAERARLAEAKRKLKAEAAERRAKEAAEREAKAAKHVAVAKAAEQTAKAEAQEAAKAAERKALAKSARRAAKNNK